VDYEENRVRILRLPIAVHFPAQSLRNSPQMITLNDEPRRANLRIIILVFVGWIVGMCAQLLLPGKSPTGFVGATLIGIAGALIAVFIGRHFGWWHPGDAPGFVLSLVAAIVLLALYRAVKRKSA